MSRTRSRPFACTFQSAAGKCSDGCSRLIRIIDRSTYMLCTVGETKSTSIFFRPRCSSVSTESPGWKNRLSTDVQNVTAILPHRFDKVRLACKDGELLVAMDRMDRLNANALRFKWLQRFGDDESFLRNLDLGDALQARLRENERCARAGRKRPNCRDVAMIAVMVRYKR